MKLVYIGLREETLELIRESPELQQGQYFSIPEEELPSSLGSLGDSDILIIGEDAGNPIQITQKVYRHDSELSILLINDPRNFQKIKQSLLFTPFIGSTVYCVSSAAGNGLGRVVKDHVQRTQQRRSYTRLKSGIADFSAPDSSQAEKIKTDYLNRAMEDAPVGLVLVNREGYILSFNRYAATLFNKTEREVLGTTMAELFPAGIQPEMQQFFSEPSAAQASKNVEYPTEEGSLFLEIVFSNVEKNDSSYKIALIKDITDQVRAQKSIEESARKVKMIVGSMPEMAWTAQPDGSIDFLNQRWFEYTGQDAAKASWQEAVHSEDLPATVSAWKNALRKKEIYQVECRYLRKADQRFRWHLTRALPVKDQEGRILSWVGTCTDIQSLKDTEKMLQATAEELAASNEELTAANEEITASNEELYEMNERLVKVNADMDNFIYTASHDLKAPITNIEGLVYILNKKLHQEEREREIIQDIFRMITSSVSRFQRTIADLTEVVKLQRLSELSPEKVDLAEIIDDVKQDLLPQIEEAGALLEPDSAIHSQVSFSRKNLKSILYNLLSNALKYRSPQRKLRIKISFFQEGKFKVLAVQDNGLGLNIKDPEKIFGMFRRMHTHVEGTGIGLYMVRKIIENEGGFIKVESEEGKGSIFKVYFPQESLISEPFHPHSEE